MSQVELLDMISKLQKENSKLENKNKTLSNKIKKQEDKILALINLLQKERKSTITNTTRIVSMRLRSSISLGR